MWQMLNQHLAISKSPEKYWTICCKHVAVCYLPVLWFSSWTVLLFGACNDMQCLDGSENGAYPQMAFLVRKMMTEFRGPASAYKLDLFAFKTHIEPQFDIASSLGTQKSLKEPIPIIVCSKWLQQYVHIDAGTVKDALGEQMVLQRQD